MAEKEYEVLGGNEWLELRQDDWYTYSHETRCNGVIVSALVYTTKHGTIDRILGRYENTPPHGEGIKLASITGGLDDGMEPLAMIIEEIKEEAGFEVDESNVEDLGMVHPSKSADTVVRLYAVDVTGMEHLRNENPEGDGSKGEEDAYCDWIGLSEAIECSDPLMHTLLLRKLI